MCSFYHALIVSEQFITNYHRFVHTVIEIKRPRYTVVGLLHFFIYAYHSFLVIVTLVFEKRKTLLSVNRVAEPQPFLSRS